MSLKLNIEPELDQDMNALFPLVAPSKTRYINMAIKEMNEKLKREKKIEELKEYFADPEYNQEVLEITQEFAAVRGKKRNV